MTPLTPESLELAAELGHLARMVARRGEVRLTIGKPGGGWAFNWREARVVADPEWLVDRSPDRCRGVVVHEGAHAALTRLQSILKPQTLARYRDLLNAVEDCRIEEWAKAALPGTAPWIRAVNDAALEESVSWPVPKARIDQYCRGLLELWWAGAPVTVTHRAVLASLEASTGAVARAVGCFPPPGARDRAAILGAQRAMWRVVERELVPRYEALLEADLREGTITHRALRERERETITKRSGTSKGARALMDDREARRAAERAAASATSGPREPRLDPGLARYRESLARVTPLVERASNELLRVLVERARTRWSGGHVTGPRLDLRRAMASEADPRRCQEVWQRASPSDRRRAEVAILVDTSGSMQGERMEAAFDALVVLLEATQRAGVPVGVWSFTHLPTLEHAAGAPLDDAARASLGRLEALEYGGTAYGEPLDAVRAHLEASSATQRIVFLLSDGEPSDEAPARAAIAKLEASGARAIALGMGPETAGLALLFETAAVNLDAHAVAERLGELLVAAITG
jgi:uncharacterized protein YegL